MKSSGKMPVGMLFLCHYCHNETAMNRKTHPDAPDPIRAEELKSNKDRCETLIFKFSLNWDILTEKIDFKSAVA